MLACGFEKGHVWERTECERTLHEAHLLRFMWHKALQPFCMGEGGREEDFFFLFPFLFTIFFGR